MIFKTTAVTPKGRNKFGNYLSGKNVTRKVLTTTYGGNDTTSQIGTTPTPEPSGTTPSFTLALSKSAGAFDGMIVAVSSVTDTVNVISYVGLNQRNAYIGDIEETEVEANYGITGIPTNGMTVVVNNNGTNNVSINITVNSSLTEYTGTLYIPTNIFLDTTTTLGDDISAWHSLKDSCKSLILEYGWSVSQNADSNYKLDLTNENCSINCDKDGNILSGATRPNCTATLYYGMTEVSGATYGISYSSQQSVSGVSINTSTGVFTFGSDFSFIGTSLEIVVAATYSGTTVGTAIMSISKAYPGADGSPATSYWLVLSTKAIHVDKDDIVNPSSITASAMMQIGQDTPTTATGCTIYYGIDVPTPATVYASPVTVTSANTQVVFSLKKDNKLVDGIETVPVLKDGHDGAKGDQGQQGAAMRGPVNWYTASEVSGRRWCNGTLSSSSYPDDAKWIDIILKDNQYYYCNTSYNEAGESWSSVSSYWTQASSQLAFIATQVLLADNAKINFLTNNEIYLMDSAGTITAGASGGNGISFWAGSNVPANAPFQVNYDGKIIAKSGTFAGYVQMPYTFISQLSHVYDGYVADERAYLVADAYCTWGKGLYPTLILPEPSASLNGFTYKIVAIPTVATKTTGQAPTITICTTSETSSFKIFAYPTLLDTCSMLGFYGGDIEITCVPVNNGTSTPSSYIWAVVQCTGGVDCYTGSSFNYSCSYTSVSGYSNEEPANCITKIKADTAIPSNRQIDTLYVDR